GDAWRPVNDVDVLLVGGSDCRAALGAAAARVRDELNLDFVDLAWTDGSWSGWGDSLANFDMKYGSIVVDGPPEGLARLPALVADELPLADATQLLLNRIGGVLSGLSSADVIDGVCRDAAAHRYLVNQYVKAAVAIGDAYLLRWRAYDVSYAARRERFSAL